MDACAEAGADRCYTNAQWWLLLQALRAAGNVTTSVPIAVNVAQISQVGDTPSIPRMTCSSVLLPHAGLIERSDTDTWVEGVGGATSTGLRFAHVKVQAVLKWHTTGAEGSQRFSITVPRCALLGGVTLLALATTSWENHRAPAQGSVMPYGRSPAEVKGTPAPGRRGPSRSSWASTTWASTRSQTWAPSPPPRPTR